MTRRSAVGLAALCFAVLLLLGLPVGAAGSASALPVASDQRPETTPDEFDATTFEITIFENESARWTVRHSRPLENETDVEQFESFTEEFTETETETFERFRDRADRLAAAGTNATDREMDAVGFSRDADVRSQGETIGFVELSFVWTNVAPERDGEVVVGDVFRGGMYINEGQRLIVRAGPNLVFEEASPHPDSMAEDGDLAESDSITWFGEQQFADQRPRLELVPEDGVDTGAAADDGDPALDPDPDGESDLLAVAALVVLIAIGLAGGIAWYRGALPGRQSDGAGPSTNGAGESPAATAGTDGSTGESGVPASELLSDEDRVLSLLEENGGRMKQVNIVEQTDWSKSKVSMLLSDMEEEGKISKLRVGRENIVSIAGQEPEAAGSPFEDE